MTDLELERLRARRFGFVSLLAWALFGTLLEAAHGVKLSAYLDHPLRRELLRLGHAHGVGTALVVLAYAALGVVDGRSARFGRLLRAAALLVPAGFALSVVGHGEADPGVAIALVPVGALSLLAGLAGIVWTLR